VNFTIMYNRATLQIDGYISSSSIIPTRSSFPTFNPATQELVVVVDPDVPITRDHRLFIEGGYLIGTTAHRHPVQARKARSWRNLWGLV